MCKQINTRNLLGTLFTLLALAFLFTTTTNASSAKNETDTMKTITASGTRAKKDAPPAKPNASLTNTYWKLIELEGQPATLGAGQKEVHMVLTSETNTIRGFSGCNQFTGSYELNDKQLQFGPMAATMMACMEGMELEQNFLSTLAETKRFSIIGESLILSNGEGQILRFESVYLQ